ncbi:biopolymer transporter ExbD [candidate division FCPU426 bacterium]|nr:biopolymer transporter ExbD [candidate division FCPU426 bacterium]
MGAAAGEEGPITAINVTPLVDVCLVLVIIFMVTAPLFSQPVMKVELPKATTDEGEATENITITIDPDDRIAVNAKEVTMDELKPELKIKLAESAEKYVIIRADNLTNHGVVLKALDLAKELGAKKLVFATEHKD